MTFSTSDSHTNQLFKKLNILDFQNTLDLNFGKFMWDIGNNYPKCLLNALNFGRLTSSNWKVIYTEKYIATCKI